jgi:uncharacterized membrane protein YhaH (DUF805 family)
MESYLKGWKHFADFKGRARRKEYWMFLLINTLISGVLLMLDIFIGLSSNGLGFGFFSIAFALAVISPNYAVAVRRLHDVGKSGWMLLIAFIPLIGVIWLLVLFVSEGNSGENQYGPDPKFQVF